MDKAVKNYLDIRVKKVLDEMKKRNMEGYYCETKEAALKKALEIIEPGSKVSLGGSQTLSQIGLIDKLRLGNFNLLDRASAKTPDEIDDIYNKAFSCDYYLMSSNAITLDGKLINMDGNGNRVAALIYGPKNVIVIAGINKLVENEEQGIIRVRQTASPINAIRLNKNTPCKSTAICHNCKEDDCICCNLVITRMSRIKNRIKVILVGQELGY